MGVNMGSFLIILIVFISVVVVSLAFLLVRLFSAPKQVDSIKKLLKQGKTQAAIKIAKQILAKDSKNYLAHYYLGKAYLADNRSELALMEYKYVNENALFSNELPEIPFRKELASLHTKFNQQNEALREYLLLTKMEPMNAENYFNVGKIYQQAGRIDAAHTFLQKCVTIDKKNAKAHAAIGYILYQSKQFNEAKREIDLAISLSPDTYSCYYYQGKILKEAKDLAGAIKAFEKAQRDNEFKQKALIERSTCYIMANRYDNAQVDLQRAIDLDKENIKQETLHARYFLASCYEKTRKIEKAIEQWEAIYKRNRSFRDVPSKLSEYKALQANDNMKDYLTCADADFLEICKNTALNALKLSSQQADIKKFGCQLVATEKKDDNWRNMRKQLTFLRFYREPEPLEDSAVREAIDQMKALNCTKAFIIASSGFTRTALAFAENRPIELIGKEKLEQLLSIGAK